MIMRTWRGEFADFDENLDTKAKDLESLGFEDCSWHNDICPSYSLALPEDKYIQIFIDYVDPALREFPEWKRFLVIMVDQDNVTTPMFKSDDWGEALTFLKEAGKSA
jgi:hypothetical protein